MRLSRRQLIALATGAAASLGFTRPGAPHAEPAPTALPQLLPRPAIISRAAWGANESYRFEGGAEVWPIQYRNYVKAFVHHTVTSDGNGDSAAIVRAIYYYHAVSLGWGDIGYNFLIDQAGRIYEGRAGGEGVVGGHALRYNPGSVGIAAIGTFTSDAPSDSMLNAYTSLLGYLCNRWGIDPRGSGFFVDKSIPNVCGHRDAIETSCPGDALYGRLGQLRNAAFNRLPDWGQVFVSTTMPRSVSPGQQLNVQFVLRNGGKRTWTGGEAFKLGFRWKDAAGNVVGPPPSQDVRTNMPRDVPLGGEVAITARFIAPPTAGGYTIEWDVVQSNVQWLSWTGSPALNIPLSVGGVAAPPPVTGPYAATFIFTNQAGWMRPGETRTVSMTVRNTGTNTWTVGGANGYRLGYKWFGSGGSQVVQSTTDDRRTSLPAAIAPGQDVTLQAQVTAPGTPGTYTLRWDMVHEGVTWFADRGSQTLDRSILVTSGPVSETRFPFIGREGDLW